MSEDSFIAGGPQNAANPAHVKATVKTRAWIAEQDTADLRAIYALPEGRRFLRRLLNETRAFHSPFSPESLQMAHDIGFQEMGRVLMTWLKRVDATALPRLLLEEIEENQANEMAFQQVVEQEKRS